MAAVSLSSGLAHKHMDRYLAGVRYLEQVLGLRVVAMPHALSSDQELYDHPELRAKDLMEAFIDPNIRGIFSTIGGVDELRILRHLDLDVFISNPKPFVGYSDDSATHLALLRAGLVSFYGPAILASLAEGGGVDDYVTSGLKTMLFKTEPAGDWPPNAGGWTAERIDWGESGHLARKRRRFKSTSPRWLQGQGTREGPLVIGCLEVLQPLVGTEWWPPLKGCFLALESAGLDMSPQRFAWFLRGLAVSGALCELQGILLGRPGGYGSKIPPGTYDTELLRVVRHEEGLTELILVSNLDFGHTDPIWTIPSGLPIRVDCATQGLSWSSAAVSE